jgi:hypothetical protein
MSPKIRFAEISATEIVYDHSTGLFPFSPRREIDRDLVARLKHSIAETGLWEPVVVRAQTLEGIAGNHRFLAVTEFATDRGQTLHEVQLPVALIDCDEGLAVSIALIKNELREDLTKWEAVRALIKTVERKPAVANTVFRVDGEVVEQLRLWEKELDYRNPPYIPAAQAGGFRQVSVIKAITASAPTRAALNTGAGRATTARCRGAPARR